MCQALSLLTRTALFGQALQLAAGNIHHTGSKVGESGIPSIVSSEEHSWLPTVAIVTTWNKPASTGLGYGFSLKFLDPAPSRPFSLYSVSLASLSLTGELGSDTGPLYQALLTLEGNHGFEPSTGALLSLGEPHLEPDNVPLACRPLLSMLARLSSPWPPSMNISGSGASQTCWNCKPPQPPTSHPHTKCCRREGGLLCVEVSWQINIPDLAKLLEFLPDVIRTAKDIPGREG